MTVAAGSDGLAQDIIKSVALYAAATGSSNAFVVGLPTAPDAYAAGLVINFLANHTITGSATVNVNSLGAKTIKKFYDQNLEAGDIKNGQIVTAIYDGTNFQMISQRGIFRRKEILLPFHMTLANSASHGANGTVSFADAATGTARGSIRVPRGTTSLDSIKVYYTREASGDVRLEFETYHATLGSPGETLEQDNTDSPSVYTSGGSDSKVDSFTVPSGAYDGLTSIAEDDIITITVERTAGDASDTYNTAWELVAIELTFS